jgi:glycosyltransferase involved in cell wall biosynthesis
MTVGIFDPYLDTLSGGEKYILQAGVCLSKSHNVRLFWDPIDEAEFRTKIKTKFGFAIDTVTFAENIFRKDVSLLERYRKSRQYDAILLLSDGSIPFVGCKLFVHFQSPMNWIQIRTFKDRLKIKRVSQFICNSQFTKQHIDKTFKIDSKVLYPPIVHPLETAVKKENIILNVGRYGINHPGSSYKKQEVLVDAFKRMQIKNWRLVLIMSMADDESQTAAVKRQFETNQIECIINPDNHQLQEMYAKAKIYWHASGFSENVDLHPDRAEHFGMTTVEAMTYGAVPIVINKGGQKEIVNQAEDGYVWNTVDELVQRTKEVIENNSHYKQLSEAARERANEFSDERFCKTLTELLT